MSYYGLLASAYTGHLNPITVLGRELQRRGHRIVVVAPYDAQARVREAGLEFLPVATVEFPDGEWERATTRMGELSGLKASRFVGHWLGHFARGILRDLPGIAAGEQFDGLVMDQISLGTESVCAALDLPMAVACCALTLHAESRVPPSIFSWRYRTSLPFRLRNQLGLFLAYSTGWPVTLELLRFRLKHGLPRMTFHYMNEMPPSLVQVAQQPAFFDFPRRHLPDHFHYTGPWKEMGGRVERDFPWDRLDGRPLIYASMGTLQNRLTHVFRIIAEACSGLEVQLVVALGRKGASAPEPLPGNPFIVDYAPQVALLQRASLVITHGGLNTTLESLSEGLPLVVVPIANDQPGIAARIAHLGVGEFMPIQKLTTTTMRQAVHRVLTTPRYRESSARIAEKLKRVNGQVLAADLIESAFTNRQRITHG
jgi:MGT family glycosyltransferase